MKRLWITGYRSYELSIFSDADPKLAVINYLLKKKIIEKIENGVEWFISGGQLGIETWALKVINDLKPEYPEIKTAMMLPFNNFGNNWNEDNVAQLELLKSSVDFYDVVSKQDYNSPQQLRNYQNFMINHTDEALLVYDEEHEGKTKYDLDLLHKYQESHDYLIDLVDFYELQEAADEFQEFKAET